MQEKSLFSYALVRPLRDKTREETFAEAQRLVESPPLSIKHPDDIVVDVHQRRFIVRGNQALADVSYIFAQHINDNQLPDLFSIERISVEDIMKTVNIATACSRMILAWG